MDKRFKILILEKDQTEMELIELQLRKSGLRYTTKRVGGMELLPNVVKEFPPDLILANFATPRFEVESAIPNIRKLVPGVPWVLYALNGNEETAVQCMKAGASDFILKKHFARFGASVKKILEVVAPQESLDRKAGQKEVKQEEDIFRQMVEQSPDLIALLNLEGRREYNNPAYAEIIEDPDILVGTDSFLDILPEDRDRIRELFFEIVRRGRGERTEYRLMDRFGETRFIQSDSGVLMDKQGKPEKIVVFSRDITDQVTAVQHFENLVAATAGLVGDEFFGALVRGLADALGVRFVLASRVTDADRRRVRSLAYWAGGALQPTFEYDVGGTTCEKVIQEGQVVFCGSGVRSKYPNMKALEAMGAESYLGVPLQGPGGDILGHVFLMHDAPMLQRERNEFVLRVMARRASVELHRLVMPETPGGEGRGELPGTATGGEDVRLRSAIEGLPFPVLMTDEAGMITLVNAKLEQLSGRKAEDLLHRRAWPLLLSGGPWQLLKEEYPDELARGDRSLVHVSVYAIPCRNSEGRISGTLAIVSAVQEASGS